MPYLQWSKVPCICHQRKQSDLHRNHQRSETHRRKLVSLKCTLRNRNEIPFRSIFECIKKNIALICFNNQVRGTYFQSNSFTYLLFLQRFAVSSDPSAQSRWPSQNFVFGKGTTEPQNTKGILLFSSSFSLKLLEKNYPWLYLIPEFF